MSRPLRILACNWRCPRHPQAGGSEVNLFEQARRWVRDGHTVTVISADPGRSYAPLRNDVIDGVRVRRMGGRFTVYLAAALYVLRHSHEFDYILDVANGIPFFTPLFSRRQVVLLVHHVHNYQWFFEFPWAVAVLGRFLERHVVPRVYRKVPVIAVSPTTRDALLASGLVSDQIQVVYNGASLPKPAIRRRQPSSPFRVVYVGRMKRYKRLPLLVHAVDRLRQEIPEIHLDLAGDGDARPELQTLIDQLGLGEHVTLHGYVSDQKKADLLRSAAVFATPSMHEGWGLSVIEANAYGCPAVAYDVPGLRTAIRHEETGLLAQTDEGFVHAISRLLTHADLRMRYSQSALRWAARFDWEECAQQTLDVLRARDTVAASPMETLAA